MSSESHEENFKAAAGDAGSRHVTSHGAFLPKPTSVLRPLRVPIVYPAHSRHVPEVRPRELETELQLGEMPPENGVENRAERVSLPTIRGGEERIRVATRCAFVLTCLISISGISLLAYTLISGG